MGIEQIDAQRNAHQFCLMLPLWWQGIITQYIKQYTLMTIKI